MRFQLIHPVTIAGGNLMSQYGPHERAAPADARVEGFNGPPPGFVIA
jgi:hypothetical protein